MALNMTTDKQFDEALQALTQKEKKTKSDIVRELVLGRYQSLQHGFQFGGLAPHLSNPKPTTEQILDELKEIKEDHDLD